MPEREKWSNSIWSVLDPKQVGQGGGILHGSPYPPTHLRESPGKSWTQTYTIWYGYAVVPWRLHEVLDLKITDLKRSPSSEPNLHFRFNFVSFFWGVSTSIRDVTCEGLLRLEA